MGSVQRECPEMFISQSSPERGIFSYFKSCWLISFLLGHYRSWHTLKDWELLKTKRNCLGNYKGLKGTKDLGQGWAQSFFSYISLVLKDWEKWLLCLRQRNQQRVKMKLSSLTKWLFLTSRLHYEIQIWVLVKLNILAFLGHLQC